MDMDVRKMRKFGWRTVQIENKASKALFPIAWGFLPLGFSWLMWFTGASEEFIPWLGAASMLFMLMGGLAGVSSRVGTLNASKVGVALASICIGVMVWALVTQGTVSVLFALLYSSASIYLLVKALDFIFKDAGYVFEMDWDVKEKLPIDALSDWDVKTTRFSQTCMAIKRFDANQYVQIYGAVKGESTFLRFDLFGCQTREQFKNLNFGVDWPEFQINELTQEE
jgi:hypothetical protein|tara:strand:- start:394 stop:1068 length:675 start_codon:yes stop_codon:yes gene_type:complete